MLENVFFGMLTLVFAIGSFIAGIFTAYFGSGRSRIVGAILIILGLIVGFLFTQFTFGIISGLPQYWTTGTIVDGIIAVVGALVGAGIALGIFLLAIMKA